MYPSKIGLLAAVLMTAVVASATEPVQVLYSFPEIPTQMVRGADGNFYGYLSLDAADVAAGDVGAIRQKLFRLTPAGEYTVVHYFEQGAELAGQPSPDSYAYGPILPAADGSLYGTILRGGENFYGGIFHVTPDGTYERIYSFTATEKIVPFARTTDGDFYGLSLDRLGYGAEKICKLSADGDFSVLYTLAKPDRDPYYARFPDAESAALPRGVISMLLASDGTIYGTTLLGGDPLQWTPAQGGGYSSYGTLFSLKPGGEFAVLRSGRFGSENYRKGYLAEAGDGTIYGCAVTTDLGGNTAGAAGEIYSYTQANGYQVVRRYYLGPTGELQRWLLGADGKSYTAVGFPYTANPYGDAGGVNIASVDAGGTETVLRSFPFFVPPGADYAVRTDIDSVLDGQDGYIYVIARTVAPIVTYRGEGEEAAAQTRSMTKGQVRYRTRNTMARVRVSKTAPNRIAAATDRVMLPRTQSSVTINVTHNDLIKPGAQPQLEIVAAPAHGGVEIVPASGKAPARVQYTVGESAPQDSFSYRVSDASGASAVGKVVLYAPLSGAYKGAVTASADGATIGSASLALGSLGAFSGNVVVKGRRLHISRGRFDANATWRQTFTIGGVAEEVVLTQQADGTIAGTLSGAVDGAFSAARR